MMTRYDFYSLPWDQCFPHELCKFPKQRKSFNESGAMSEPINAQPHALIASANQQLALSVCSRMLQKRAVAINCLHVVFVCIWCLFCLHVCGHSRE